MPAALTTTSAAVTSLASSEVGSIAVTRWPVPAAIPDSSSRNASVAPTTRRSNGTPVATIARVTTGAAPNASVPPKNAKARTGEA